MAQRVAVVPLLLRHDFGMSRSVITVCFSDDLPSTLTNQSASLYDEIPYDFEHTRLRTRNSRYSVSAGQFRRRSEKLPELATILVATDPARHATSLSESWRS